MASAVLTNRSEPNRMQPKPRGGAKLMGEIPFSNPNPKFSKKRQLAAAPAVHVDESPAVTQSAASDDAWSVNRRPRDFSSGGFVTFNVASYSKKELVELKNQFVAELDRVRQLKNRIDSSSFQIRSNGGHGKKPIGSSKKASGNKRPYPDLNLDKTQLMKNCGSILTKLMKHKHGYIFNTPVDVVGLKLHDYHDIIKNPMDLGTVKSKLSKNLYNSPWDFAADVRLTFNNAMRYNPKGHEVYVLAEQQLAKFEELYQPLREKVGDEDQDEHIQEVQASSWDHRDRFEMDQESIRREKTEQIGNSLPGSGLNQNANAQSAAQLPVRTPSPMRAPPVKPVKQPKPKAKDPNKREMSLEEKHKLGLGLQSLPQEKMEQVVQIIKKRNGHLRQEGDEIELDIEAVDTETLWELDRFVTNYKKLVSKIKRQALMGINNNNVAVPPSDSHKDVPVNERMDVGSDVKKPKKGEAGDEDVDIGDEMPMNSFPPVEIEKDNGHASSSSSSSSSSSDDSSSSSDSDSGSSSGSDSEDAHS